MSENYGIPKIVCSVFHCIIRHSLRQFYLCCVVARNWQRDSSGTQRNPNGTLNWNLRCRFSLTALLSCLLWLFREALLILRRPVTPESIQSRIKDNGYTRESRRQPATCAVFIPRAGLRSFRFLDQPGKVFGRFFSVNGTATVFFCGRDCFAQIWKVSGGFLSLIVQYRRGGVLNRSKRVES